MLDIKYLVIRSSTKLERRETNEQ